MRRLMVGVILILAVMSSSSCSVKQSPEKEREALAKAESGEILIGVLSDFEAKTGYIDAVRLAVEQTNSDGGIRGRKIKILEADDKSDVTKGISIAQSFVDNPKVAAAIGHWDSYVTIPAAEIYEHGGVVMLTPAATSSRLIKNGYRYVFRGIPSDVKIGGHIAQLMYKKGCRKTVIYYPKDDYGIGQANAFEDAAVKEGLSIIDRLTYMGNEQEFLRIIQKWYALDFDSIFIVNSMPEAGEFIKRIRNVGIKVPVFGTDGLDGSELIQVCGKDAEGVVITSFYNPDSTRYEVVKFEADFRAAYGRKPDVWAAQGYEAMKLITYAMKKAGSASPVKISEELHSLRNWSGVTGNLSFDQTGEISGNTIFNKIVVNGKFVYISN